MEGTTAMIPPMTDPMGRHWKQPPRELIEIDDTHALMSAHTLATLAEYSASIPSGVFLRFSTLNLKGTR